MFAQVHSRSLSALLSFRTQLPFDRLPPWKEIRKLPLEEQRQQAARSRAAPPVDRGRRHAAGRHARAAPRPAGPTTTGILVFDTVEGPHRSVAEVARERNQHPAEVMIDLALEKNLDLFFLQPIANEDQDYRAGDHAPPAHGHDVLGLRRPRLAAHGFLAPDAPAEPLGARRSRRSRWSRRVRMLTLVPATLWGFHDRGLIREGMAADLVVFDPDTIAAEMPEVVDDLPAGARRLIQRCRGVARHGGERRRSPLRNWRRHRRAAGTVATRPRWGRRG